MQVILTKEEYDELVAKAKPLELRQGMELAKALAIQLSQDAKQFNYNVVIEKRVPIQDMIYTHKIEYKHYRVTVERVEENE